MDFRDRAQTFGILEQQVFDLLVIGAGISGAGVARDAAMRGMRVCLVEARDIASGTSSKSSKMIHGGLRYLAQGDVGLVSQAAQERRTLRQIAPHLATTLPMIITSKKKTGLAKFRTGLWTYEKLGKVAPEEKHENLDVKELSKREPYLRVSKLAGAVQFPEYLTDDARLTLANVRSAVEAGATVATYAEVKEILVNQGKAHGARVYCARVCGVLPNETFSAQVRAKLVVNAAGPWVDGIRQLEDATAPKKMQLTKGIHIVFKKARLPVNSSVVMTTHDKRSIFTCPREGYVYVGTTDTLYPHTDYVPEVTSEDIDYLLDLTNQTFDVGPLTCADIVSMWSGIRPPIGEEGKSPSEISRKDEILLGRAGVLTLAGGKLTAYRAMAEKLVDRCEKELGRGRLTKPCTTADKVLPGGNIGKPFAAFQLALEAKGLSPVEAERLTRLYGDEAPILAQAENLLDAEIQQAVLKEGALTLEDYWVRRSARAHFSDGGGVDALEQMADKMAALLNWSENRKQDEVNHCLAVRKRELAALACPEKKQAHAGERNVLSG